MRRRLDQFRYSIACRSTRGIRATVTIEASALHASFAGAAFRGRPDIRLRWAQVRLEDSDFAEPSLIIGLQAPLTSEGGKPFLGWVRPEGDGSWSCAVKFPPRKCVAPRLLSLCGARVAQLTLSRVDLSECRFAGSYDLDELRAGTCSSHSHLRAGDGSPGVR